MKYKTKKTGPPISLSQDLSLDVSAILIRIMQDADVLWPNGQRYITPGLTPGGHFTAELSERRVDLPWTCNTALDEIHLPYELGHKEIRRMGVDLPRRADL